MLCRASSGALGAVVLACAVGMGCTNEQDRIEDALDRALEARLAGCVPIAWKASSRIRGGYCGTGDWRSRIPSTLAALSLTDRVRVISGEPETSISPRHRQFELAGGVPIARVSNVAGTASYLCWADVDVRVTHTGPLEVHKGVLTVNVWYQSEITPKSWAAHLDKGALDTCSVRRNSVVVFPVESASFVHDLVGVNRVSRVACGARFAAMPLTSLNFA